MKLLLLAIPLLLVGCQNPPAFDADGLPHITQTGADTGGFMLDGQPFANAWDGRLASGYRKKAGWQIFVELKLSLLDEDITSPRQLLMMLDSVTGPGLYQATAYVNPSDTALHGSCLVAFKYRINAQGRLGSKRSSLVTGTNAPGRILLTRFDTVNNIVAGTFEGKLREMYGPAVYRISKGRFDCKFYQYQ